MEVEVVLKPLTHLTESYPTPYPIASKWAKTNYFGAKIYTTGKKVFLAKNEAKNNE